jgi:microcystin-dependent protein
MSCSNCFNGCAEIVSDQCVRYTGIDVPVLGIKNGDSLSFVEQALIEFLTSTLNGSGITITIPEQILCQFVKDNLPTCGPITADVLFQTLVKCVCNLQAQTTDIYEILNEINGPFALNCLTGVTVDSTNHQVLQAVIDKLCLLQAAFDAFVIDVETNYVQLADLDDLIQAYLNSQSTSTNYNTKMIPYTAVEYYGPLTGNFDVTGAGIGVWQKIYLCNGNNGTPDKRGRVPVGAIVGVGGGSLDAAVDPNISPFNPAYAISGATSKSGVNSVILTQPQIPSHTHIATVTPNPHDHSIAYSTGTQYQGSGSNPAVQALGTGGSTATTGTVNLVIANSSVGGDQAHQNNQPALACYYIMYIP